MRCKKNRMNPNVLVFLFAILAAAFLSTDFSPALAQEMEVIAGGEIEYQRYCAICHGVDGRGRGIMAKFLMVQPSDLTALSKKYSGKFPFWQIYRVIDGREEVRGHGTREMPIWGARFQAAAGGSDIASRAQVAGQILSLVFYLEYLQR